MRAGINCALANRQVLTQLLRDVFADFFPDAHLEIIYDVSHNTCKFEKHLVDGTERELYVHRKGATRAFAPGHPELPESLRPFGQPVLIGGSMGTSSWVLTGMEEGEKRSWASSCHGAGRSMSRHEALKHWRGRELVTDLKKEGILIRSRSMRGVAEEAPEAYKDVDEVVRAAERAGLSRRVAKLTPIICVKG
jgi:tRNA-splicing ligase RtcB